VSVALRRRRTSADRRRGAPDCESVCRPPASHAAATGRAIRDRLRRKHAEARRFEPLRGRGDVRRGGVQRPAGNDADQNREGGVGWKLAGGFSRQRVRDGRQRRASRRGRRRPRCSDERGDRSALRPPSPLINERLTHPRPAPTTAARRRRRRQADACRRTQPKGSVRGTCTRGGPPRASPSPA